jgi:hypothetical protein
MFEFERRCFELRRPMYPISARPYIPASIGIPSEFELSAKRMVPGPPGVFGMDEIDIIVTGHSDGAGSASCTGFAKQSPGLRLEVMLIRMRDERRP